jgi:hypothetical protein
VVLHPPVIHIESRQAPEADQTLHFGRRTFLRAGTVAGLVVTGVAGAPATAAAAAAETGRGPLRFADYLAQVGTTFTTRDAAGQQRVLLLAEAAPSLVNALVPGSGEAYSLIFRGDPRERMPAATRELRHAVLGSVGLFLHPVGPGRSYEAVINQWRPSGRLG